MSSAISLRSFLMDLGLPVDQIHQGHVPEESKQKLGFIWYGRRGVEKATTLDQFSVAGSAQLEPDEQFFDIEAYHPDIAVIEQITQIIHAAHCYRGDFGDGEVQAVFVNDQTDEYVPQVETTDKENLSAAFLSFEVRCYREFD